jgi:dolichol-phosphate mannosyltransferase
MSALNRASVQIDVAVVIPCYRVTRHIEEVIGAMPAGVWRIYAVDDCCPDQSGEHVRRHVADGRVRVLRNEENQGVGGAVMAGYRAAIADGAAIIVKIDGDGQMDPSLLWRFVEPIAAGEADYTKGNRFYNLEQLRQMPGLRLLGNAALSFMSKLSTGYWDVFDPTNGYTAIHADMARLLPLEKISRRYFFETDMLFRLNTLRAVVVDVPMDARYGGEVSSLRISRVAFEFLGKHTRNFFKRVFYSYYLRDMSVASFELPIGIASLLFGVAYGSIHWIRSSAVDVATPAGTVMLSGLPVIVGVQLLLAFLAHDVASVPRRPVHRR